MLLFRDALSFYYLPAVDLVRRHRKKKRYATVLQEIYGEAVQWVSFMEVKRIVFSIAQRISEAPVPQQLMKGEPDLSPIQRRCASIILDCIDWPEDSAKGQDMLRAAQKLASLFPDDIDAFRLYVAVFWIVNYTVITSLRDAIRTPYVAVHMTCRPRMERAASSIVSFAAIPSYALAHVTLIGNGSTFAFDAGKNILEVPAGDAYEHLPAKVFSCYQILVMSCNPACIIKLDDDHRLANPKDMLALLYRATRHREPVQLGFLRRLKIPSANSRGWHIGKCADEIISQQPWEMPAPLTFICGGLGYVLNRPALWRMAWATLYYRQWLDAIPGYEDVAVGEVAEKTWIRKLHSPINAISAITDY
jgi:hypothetical protein